MRVSRFVNVNTSSHRRLFIITLYVCCHNTYRPARSWRFPPSRVCLCITPDHTAYPPSRFLFVSADWCLVFCMLILSVLSILYTYCVEYYVVFHGPYQSYSAFSFCSVSLSFIFLISSFHASSVRWSGMCSLSHSSSHCTNIRFCSADSAMKSNTFALLRSWLSLRSTAAPVVLCRCSSAFSVL